MGALRWIGALGLGVGLTLTACGGGDDGDANDSDTGGGDAQTLTVKSSDALKFDPEELSATGRRGAHRPRERGRDHPLVRARPARLQAD